MSDALLVVLFLASALVSLLFSWILVTAIERVGARLGLTEGLLGMLAALAADAPEITAAVTALAGHHPRIGAGVVIGSNVFNLAALLGLTAVVAGRIALHRRVIEFNGAVALWIGAVCLLVVVGALSPLAGLLATAGALAPYIAVLALGIERLARLRLPVRWTGWLSAAVKEEELELEVAFHPRRGEARDGVLAALAALVVVGVSIAMERTASQLGTRHAVPEIVTGALVLAAVTSLPNAVAAIYLAARGRGAAVLSTALNSNAINVLAGLLLPGALVGLGTASGQTTFLAASYVGLTAFTLLSAYVAGGLRRWPGALVIAAYCAFVTVVLASSA
jgi:cation:H+ antiporter